MKRGRRNARETALSMLYAKELTARGEKCPAMLGIESDEEVDPFAKRLYEGVSEHLEDIDQRLRSSSPNWRIERMSLIDRNVLRMGCFELLFMDEIPARVTINEAVDLAKKFGGEDSGAFVNGVLDQIARISGKLRSGDSDEGKFCSGITGEN